MKKVTLINKYGDELEANYLVYSCYPFRVDNHSFNQDDLEALGWYIKEPRKPKKYYLKEVYGDELIGKDPNCVKPLVTEE